MVIREGNDMKLQAILKRKPKQWIEIMRNTQSTEPYIKDDKLICYDGYNYKHEVLPLLFLDSYGDENQENQGREKAVSSILI